jgi:hypothetical protein
VTISTSSLLSPEEKDKQKKTKIGHKIYVLQYTLYVCRNVHLGFLNFLSYMFCFCSVKYSELCLAGISQNPYRFKSLYPSKKPATVTQQLQKSIDFRQNELYDFHLWPENSHFSKNPRNTPQLWEYFTGMGCGYICHMAGSGCTVCLLCGDCFVCYEVNNACHKVKVFVCHEVKFICFPALNAS